MMLDGEDRGGVWGVCAVEQRANARHQGFSRAELEDKTNAGLRLVEIFISILSGPPVIPTVHVTFAPPPWMKYQR